MLVFAVFDQIYQIGQSTTNSNTNIPLFHTVIDQVQIQIHKQIKRSVYLNTHTNMYMTPSLVMTWCDFVAATLSRDVCVFCNSYHCVLMWSVGLGSNTIIKYKYKYEYWFWQNYKCKYKYKYAWFVPNINTNTNIQIQIQTHFSHLKFLPLQRHLWMVSTCLFNVQSSCHKHVINCLVKTTTHIYTQ